MIRNHFVCSCYSWLKSYTSGQLKRLYQFYPPLQDMYVFIYIYIFLSFLRWDVSSHQTNMSMFIVNKLLSFFTSSLCWDPSSLHCLTHRRGSCPPCYRNWVPRSPSRLPLPLPSKCPCASGRQARMMGRYSPENEHVEPQQNGGGWFR